MLRLNDDCLCRIFDKLKLRDQLRLTAVCERFRDIIVSLQWRSRFRYFVKNEESDALSRKEFHSLLKLIVHSIEHLDIIYDIGMEQISTEYTVWRPRPAFYLRFKFPVLRRLECLFKCNEGDIHLLAANCPQIEELYLYNKIEGNPWPSIVLMRHLRVLRAECAISAYDLQQILTALPLTQLRIKKFLEADDPRLLAEAVMSASDLLALRMGFVKNTPAFMECMMALASTSERRNPLTIHIEEDILKLMSSINPDDLPYSKYRRSLQSLMDNQCASSPYTILLSADHTEFRFFCQSNEK